MRSPGLVDRRDEPKDAYRMSEGFVLRFEYLANIPQQIERVKIDYCIAVVDEQIFVSGVSKEWSVENCQIQKLGWRIPVKNVPADKDIVLYIELKGKSASSNQWFEIWTLQKLFDRSNDLDSGKFRIPFYPFEVRPQSVLAQEATPKIKGVTLFLQIWLPIQDLIESSANNQKSLSY